MSFVKSIKRKSASKLPLTKNFWLSWTNLVVMMTTETPHQWRLRLTSFRKQLWNTKRTAKRNHIHCISSQNSWSVTELLFAKETVNRASSWRCSWVRHHHIVTVVVIHTPCQNLRGVESKWYHVVHDAVYGVLYEKYYPSWAAATSWAKMSPYVSGVCTMLILWGLRNQFYWMFCVWSSSIFEEAQMGAWNVENWIRVLQVHYENGLCTPPRRLRYRTDLFVIMGLVQRIYDVLLRHNVSWSLVSSQSWDPEI